MPKTVLLTAGTHKMYAKRAPSPGFHKDGDKKGGQFTLHHVMPYRYAFFVGFVVEQLIRTAPTWTAVRGGGGLKQRLVSVYNRLAPMPGVTDATLLQLAHTGDKAPDLRVGHHFAWMGANLFVGPSGSWRLDDPHTDIEPTRPQSFDDGRWNALHALKRYIDTYAYDFDDTAKEVSTIQIVLEEGQFVSGLMERLEALTGYGRDAHPFTPSDWIVLDSDGPAWGMAQRALATFLASGRKAGADDTTASEAKALFLQVIEKDKLRRPEDREVTEMAPVAHRDVRFAGASAPEHWAVMWRLRLDGEKVPATKFKANFELQ